MNRMPFQKIYEIIAPQLPDDWSRVVLYMQYEQDSFSMKYYVKMPDGKYTECFKLSGVKRSDIINSFIEIDDLINPIRRELKPKDKWTMATMIITPDGKFKCDFSYKDVSEDTLAYLKVWKTEYLI